MTETIHSPTSRSITFADPTEFEAKGRNGFMKTTGITLVQMLNGEVHLGCITSKGVSSDAVRLPVPKSAVIPLANALLAMVQADQVTGQETVVTPEQAEAAQTLLEIAIDSGGDLAGLAQAVANALDGDRIVIRDPDA
jgi:hypothetical protein